MVIKVINIGKYVIVMSKICKILQVLNQIVYGLPAEHPLAKSSPLGELLGHTPPQVIAGGLLGIMTSTIIYLISHSGNNT
ncbi:hypothetical protein Hdeb2414_s0014g00424061 [Helianthus debilis subsp. tardiflorus]